jgi:hypothetical protein
MADQTHRTDDGHAPGSETPAPTRRAGARGADVRDAVAEMTVRAHEISQDAGARMTSALRDVINAAAGLAGFAVESARDLVQFMVRRGQMSASEAEQLLRDAEAAHARQVKANPPATKPQAAPAKAGTKSAAKRATSATTKAPAKAPARKAAPAKAETTKGAARPAKAAAPAKGAAKTASKAAAKTAKATRTPSAKAGAKGAAKPAKATSKATAKAAPKKAVRRK